MPLQTRLTELTDEQMDVAQREDERLIYRVARALYQDRRVDAELYALAVETFDEPFWMVRQQVALSYSFTR